jgi:NAD(P)-dependent dehydrogenase (short-subunit alcohol dehydrogenase family)
MAAYNIRANMVHPGPTDTERLHPEWYAGSEYDKKGIQNLLKSIPLGRKAKVDDIAHACLFLASDEAGYITGEQLNVVGGRYML